MMAPSRSSLMPVLSALALGALCVGVSHFALQATLPGPLPHELPASQTAAHAGQLLSYLLAAAALTAFALRPNGSFLEALLIGGLGCTFGVYQDPNTWGIWAVILGCALLSFRALATRLFAIPLLALCTLGSTSGWCLLPFALWLWPNAKIRSFGLGAMALTLGILATQHGLPGADAARLLGWLKPGSESMQPSLAFLAAAFVFQGLRRHRGVPSFLAGFAGFLLGAAVAWILCNDPATRTKGIVYFALALALSRPLQLQPAVEASRSVWNQPALALFAVLALLTTASLQWQQRKPLEREARTATATLVERLDAAQETNRPPTHLGGLPADGPRAEMIRARGIHLLTKESPLATGSPQSTWSIWWWSDAQDTPGGEVLPAALVRMIDAPIASAEGFRLEAPSEEATTCTSLQDEPKFEWSLKTPPDPSAVTFRFLALGIPRGQTIPQWHEVRLHEGQITSKVVGDRTHYAWRPSWRSDVGQTVEREILWAEEELAQRGSTLFWTILCTDVHHDHPVRLAAGRRLPILP